MYGLIREEGSFGANPGTKDLARHLYTRMGHGKTVVVTGKPNSVLPALRKQWLKLARKVKKESASTLDSTRIYELTEVIARMRTLRFSVKWPSDGYEPADVYLTTIEESLRWAPDCQTMYVTCKVELEELHRITSWMPRGSLVVMCELRLS